jgi:hypothetical protein
MPVLILALPVLPPYTVIDLVKPLLESDIITTKWTGCIAGFVRHGTSKQPSPGVASILCYQYRLIVIIIRSVENKHMALGKDAKEQKDII